MSLWSKIRGTTEALFQLGKSGPQVKNNAGAVEARNAADAAFATVRVATPVGNDDATTKAYADAVTAAVALPANEYARGTGPSTIIAGDPTATSDAGTFQRILDVAALAIRTVATAAASRTFTIYDQQAPGETFMVWQVIARLNSRLIQSFDETNAKIVKQATLVAARTIQAFYGTANTVAAWTLDTKDAAALQVSSLDPLGSSVIGITATALRHQFTTGGLSGVSLWLAIELGVNRFVQFTSPTGVHLFVVDCHDVAANGSVQFGCPKTPYGLKLSAAVLLPAPILALHPVINITDGLKATELAGHGTGVTGQYYAAGPGGPGFYPLGANPTPITT